MSIPRLALAAVAAGLLVAGAHRPRAAEPAPAPLVTKVYAVADLLVPIPDGPTTPFLKDSPTGPDHVGQVGVNAQLLTKYLTATVRPFRWNDLGGPGTVDFYAATHSLVVTQTAEVQDEVAKCLESLRRVAERQVSVEMRVMTVAADFFERCGVDCPAAARSECGKTAAVTLTAAQVRLLTDAAQKDGRAEVLSCPKMTVLHGQTGRFQVGQQQSFVTAIRAESVDGQVVAVPQNKVVDLGITMAVKPAVSPDQKAVRLDVDFARTALASPTVRLYPVTTMITPVFEGGSQGHPIPFTQFLQAPELNTQKVSVQLAVADGGTTLVPLGTETIETRTEFGPPVLSKLPYVNRMFKNVAIGKEERKVLMLLTARVIDPAAQAKEAVVACPPVMCEAACAKPAVVPVSAAVPAAVPAPVPPAVCAKSAAAELVRQYRAACAAGQPDAAATLAAQAIALDPTCFQTPAVAPPGR